MCVKIDSKLKARDAKMTTLLVAPLLASEGVNFVVNSALLTI